MQDKLCITVDEMAKQLSISRSMAYELACSKGFPSIRTGRRILINVNSLEKWLTEKSKENEHE